MLSADFGLRNAEYRGGQGRPPLRGGGLTFWGRYAVVLCRYFQQTVSTLVLTICKKKLSDANVLFFGHVPQVSAVGFKGICRFDTIDFLTQFLV